MSSACPAAESARNADATLASLGACGSAETLPEQGAASQQASKRHKQQKQIIKYEESDVSNRVTEVDFPGPPADVAASPNIPPAAAAMPLADSDSAFAASSGLHHSALIPGREEEFTDGSDDDLEDDDDAFAGDKGHGEDSAPCSIDSEGARTARSPTSGIDAAAAPDSRVRGTRQRIRIRGYRPLDELRSFAKVLITSLNREFVTPRLDYSVPPPANLLEGLGDAHIMGSTLYNQMKTWLNGSTDECARDMAAYFKVKGEFGVPNRANRYHVEFTLKKFLLPKVVTMFCQRQLLTEIMLQNGLPANFYTDRPDASPSLDTVQKETLLKIVHSALAEVDKLWPMSPSTDEVDDDKHRKQVVADSAPNSASSAHTSSPPPVNNAFQVHGRVSVLVPQLDDGDPAASGDVQQDLVLKSVWIRPWDSVFDRKKNGFGTFFAKEVLELCHCDDVTIARILGISMRHIAVKKSEMVFKKSINATLAAGHAVAGLIAPVIKRNREAASSLDDFHNQSPTKASAHMYSLAADALGGAAGVQIPIKLNKSTSSCAQQHIAQQQSTPMIDISLTAEQELLIKMTLGLVWAHITSQGHEHVERDISMLEPMVLQVFRNPIACMCGALGLPYNSPYSKELVLLDLAVMKAASQPHMHGFYAQILAQRDAYARQALPLLQKDQADTRATAASNMNSVSNCTKTETPRHKKLPSSQGTIAASSRVESHALATQSHTTSDAVSDAAAEAPAQPSQSEAMTLS